MEKRILLFDLDGTLTDSGEGIINCGQIVLKHYGLPVPSRQDMRCMVGPPLRESFPRFGIQPEDVDDAIELYRRHYNNGGIFQNSPYPGIHALLEKLQLEGYLLCVATSKPENMAKIILEHFNMDRYFHRICGASSDYQRFTKSQVIAYLINQLHNTDRLLMVGDTIYDVEGAAEFHIPTIGVSWGYGNVDEMKAGGAVAIVNTMQELYEAIKANE